MFSPTILVTAGAAALSLAGLLVAQINGAQPSRPATSVTLIGEAATQTQPPTLKARVTTAGDRQNINTVGATGFGGEFGFEDESGGMMMMSMGGEMTPVKPRLAKNTWATAHPHAYERIEAELAKSTDVDYNDLPLQDVVAHLQTDHGIPIVVEAKALHDLGLSPDEPVTLKLSSVSLESALSMILDDLELTFTIDDEVLCVTTEESDESNHQLLRVYWSSQSGLQADEGSAALIKTMVEPDRWAELGGQGEISILGAPDEKHSGLAIRATYRVHRKIERFLESIRSGTTQAVSGTTSVSPAFVGVSGPIVGIGTELNDGFKTGDTKKQERIR